MKKFLKWSYSISKELKNNVESFEILTKICDRKEEACSHVYYEKCTAGKWYMEDILVTAPYCGHVYLGRKKKELGNNLPFLS